MVQEVIIIPEDKAQETARDAGEVTREAVKQRYSEATRDQWRRELRRGDLNEAAVLVGLEDAERSMLREVVASSEVDPGEWLRRAVAKQAEESASRQFTSLEEQLSWALLSHYEPNIG